MECPPAIDQMQPYMSRFINEGNEMVRKYVLHSLNKRNNE